MNAPTQLFALKSKASWLLLVFGTALLSACSDAETGADSEAGPLMRPGEDCLACHSEGSGTGAPVWTAAGTVFSSPTASRDQGVENVSVIFSTLEGMELLRLITNRAGNFYTPSPLPAQYRVTLEYQGQSVSMPCSPPAGLCNACHQDPVVIGDAMGRLYVPGGGPAPKGTPSCPPLSP